MLKRWFIVINNEQRCQLMFSYFFRPFRWELAACTRWECDIRSCSRWARGPRRKKYARRILSTRGLCTDSLWSSRLEMLENRRQTKRVSFWWNKAGHWNGLLHMRMLKYFKVILEFKWIRRHGVIDTFDVNF